jgi:hypothetical protein
MQCSVNLLHCNIVTGPRSQRQVNHERAAMLSTREQVLSALFHRLRSVGGATVKRNEALPRTVPAAGLVILRDGQPGEPDVTLNPRSEFYSHGVEIEAYVPQPVTGGGEAELDRLLSAIGSALAADPSLGGLVESLLCSAPEVEAVAIEGAAPILSARLTVTIDYLVSDPLAAA